MNHKLSGNVSQTSAFLEMQLPRARRIVVSHALPMVTRAMASLFPFSNETAIFAGLSTVREF